MDKVKQALEKLKVNSIAHSRIKDESFASEVYSIQTDSDEFVLKFSHSEVKFWREFKTLEFLAGKIPVPEILQVLNPEDKMPGAIFMKRIEGKPIAPPNITPQVTKECGNLLAQLHKISFSDVGCFSSSGFEKYPFSSWWDYRKDLLFEKWTKVIETKVEPELIQKAKSVFQDFYKKFSDDRICLVHCDYRPGNLLLHSDHVNGIIDFESSRSGDRAYDFIKFFDVIGGELELWKSFLSGYSEIDQIPDLENLIPYYELDLNYGFLFWSIDRSDKQLFKNRLELFKKLLKKWA